MQTQIRWSVVALALASLAIVATPAPSEAGLKRFVTVINGAQETPPNPSTALGNGVVTYDPATDTLCYYVTYIGLLSGGEILAHIHGPADPGTPAGIVLDLPLGNTKQACVLSPAAPFNKKDLLKGRYYVNIHSVGFPAGEIRGQILRVK